MRRSYFEKFDPAGNALNQRRRRRTGSSSSAPPSADRSRGTGRSSSRRSSGSTSTPTTSSPSTTRRSCAIRSRRGPRHAGRDHQQRRASGRDRQRAVRRRDRRIPRQGRSPAQVGQQPDGSLQLRRQPEREHRAVRRPGREQPRRRISTAPTTCWPLPTPASSARSGSTSCGSSSPSANQNVISLDPRCDGTCDREDEGGPTVEMIGVASVGRQRFTPQPRTNDRYQFLDTISVFRRATPAQGGRGLQHHQAQGPGAAAAFRRPLYLRGLSGGTGAAVLGLPVAISRSRPSRSGFPARYVQGYGEFRHGVRLQRPLAVRAGRLASATGA